MSDKTTVDQLVEKISREYEIMREGWWDMTAGELIDNAEQVAAVKFIMANAGDCILDDAAEYLLQFRKPLEILVDAVKYRYDPMNIAERETFGDLIYDLCDKHDLDSDHETEENEGIAMQ